MLKKSIKYELIVPILVFVFGICFAFVITPLSEPDGPFHYQMSFVLSNHFLFQDDPTKADASYFDYTGLTPHFNTKSSIERMKADLFKENQNTHEITIPASEKSFYPFMYVPQALGITVARLLNFNFVKLYYMGRIFNLLFFVFCVYISFKLLPCYKNFFACLCFFPIVMQQVSSYSYDCFIIGLTFVLFALLIKCICSSNKITTKDLVFIGLVYILVTPTKIVYAPIILLFLLIPSNKFKSIKQKLVSFLAFVSIALILVVCVQFRELIKVTSNEFVNLQTRLPNYGAIWVVKNPIKALKIIINTIKLELVSYVFQAVGSRLSGLSLYLPHYLLYIFFTCIFVSLFTKDSEESIDVNLRDRVFSFIGFTISFILILLSMLVSWTTVGSETIEGIQGRYFIPIIPFLAITLSTNKTKKNNFLSIFLILICCLAEILVIKEIISITVLQG